LCLLLAGTIAPDYRALLDARLNAETGRVQVIRRYQYIPDEEASAYFYLADIALTLYQNHYGPSNIVLLAAAAGRPLLSTSSGIMGHTVRKHALGLTVDVNDAGAVARGLMALLNAPEKALGDANQIRTFVAGHHPRRFAQAFFDALQQK
jgi:glycosyltransferase involved in cell wall biosynthesis